jgi:hypothetical protein
MTIVDALKSAGEELQKKSAGPISWRELRALVVERCGCSEDSVLPSDHCYNLKNKGHAKRKFEPMFLCVSRGQFFYVGEGFEWIGPFDEHPKGGAAESTQI